MLKLICATKCSNIHMHPHIYSQDSLYFISYPCCLAWCGTAALEPRHCRDLSDRWGLGGIYTLPLPPQQLSASSSSLQHAQNRVGALSPSIVDLKPPSKSIDFPSIFEGKGSKTRLESSSIYSPTLKSTWFTFWSVVICYSWSLAPSQLEHRPWSLPTCVVAPGGM